MSFTSLPFYLFFAAVLLVFYFLPKTGQKVLLLAASYVFYLWAVPVFGLLLAGTTLVSYLLARLIARAQTAGKKRLFLALGCVLQFGLLFLFKYLGYVCDLLKIPQTLELLLPVGISFFTFAVTGYLFDVYRGKCAAEKNLLDYSVFVAFFPSLLAGPIGKAREFLPQLREKHRFDLAGVKTGVLRFLWGMLQKLLIADTIAICVNAAYAGSLPAASIRWAFLLYPLQIYFDFAGYSNMAIGVAKAFGFRLTENFETPYLSLSVRSFWKKWHISLTDWFREYLYFPLGGSRKGKLRTWLNILIVFAVSGLWHGAATTYLAWGLLNGGLQVAETLLAPVTKRLDAKLENNPLRFVRAALRGVLTYLLIAVTWVFFRAGRVLQAFYILKQLVVNLFAPLHPLDLGVQGLQFTVLLAAVALGILGDVFHRKQPLQRLSQTTVPYYLAAAAIVFAVALFGVYGTGFDPQSFIYFQY